MDTLPKTHGPTGADMDLSYECNGMFVKFKETGSAPFKDSYTKRIMLTKKKSGYVIRALPIEKTKRFSLGGSIEEISLSDITTYDLRSDRKLATPLLHIATINGEYVIKFDVDHERAAWMATLVVAFSAIKKNNDFARYVLFLVRLDSTNFRNPHLLHLIPDEEPKEVVIEDPTTREDVHRFYLMQVLSYGSKSSNVLYMTYTNSMPVKSHDCVKQKLEFKCTWVRSLEAILARRWQWLGLTFKPFPGTNEFIRVFPGTPTAADQQVTSPTRGGPIFRRSLSTSQSLDSSLLDAAASNHGEEIPHYKQVAPVPRHVGHVLADFPPPPPLLPSDYLLDPDQGSESTAPTPISTLPLAAPDEALSSSGGRNTLTLPVRRKNRDSIGLSIDSSNIFSQWSDADRTPTKGNSPVNTSPNEDIDQPSTYENILSKEAQMADQTSVPSGAVVRKKPPPKPARPQYEKAVSEPGKQADIDFDDCIVYDRADSIELSGNCDVRKPTKKPRAILDSASMGGSPRRGQSNSLQRNFAQRNLTYTSQTDRYASVESKNSTYEELPVVASEMENIRINPTGSSYPLSMTSALDAFDDVTDPEVLNETVDEFDEDGDDEVPDLSDPEYSGVSPEGTLTESSNKVIRDSVDWSTVDFPGSVPGEFTGEFVINRNKFQRDETVESVASKPPQVAAFANVLCGDMFDSD